MEDHNFHAVVKEAYFAFEALGQHPYDFVSYLHGFYPEVLCIDGCAKISTDNVSKEQFEIARVERYVDMDLQHVLLILSMISKMVFNKRLRWVEEATPTFGPPNRISNLMFRTARGKMAAEGSPENGDVGELTRALGDGAISDLSGKTVDDLKNIFRLCFPGGKGISRYPTKEALVQCFEDLWKSAVAGGAGERCSKAFVGKAPGTSAGVEGLFARDGVMIAHAFQLTKESPRDAVDMLVHLMVQAGLLITDVPCMIVPIAEKLYPGLLDNGGALPRNAEGQVSLPGLQHIGAHAHQFPDEHHVKLPLGGFPSAPASTASGIDPVDPVVNVYAVFAGAKASRSVQPHLDFRALLGRAAAVVQRNLDAAAAEEGIPATAEEGAPATAAAAIVASQTEEQKGGEREADEDHTPVSLLSDVSGDSGDASGGGDGSGDGSGDDEGSEEPAASFAYASGASDTSSSPKRICELAGKSLKSLHKQGCYAMTLFDVVLVYALWFQAAGKLAVDAGEAVSGVGGGDEVRPERAITDLPKSELLFISTFLMEVMRVAVGSTATTGLDMKAPAFFANDVLFDGLEEGAGETTPILRDLENAVNRFHTAKVSYITDLLGAENDGLRNRAYGLVKAGIGFGVAEHSVKALQMALSDDSLGGVLDEDGKLPGYTISFNFKRTRSFDEFGHFYGEQRVGLWLGPDGPHEGNHQGSCQAKHGGVARCPQLTGSNCNVHEQNHAKKTKYLPSVSGMGFDTFTFNINLINELENAAINRKTCKLAVMRATEHPHNRIHACCAEVWICGRCFCSSPLMRSFDVFGKLRITHT